MPARWSPFFKQLVIVAGLIGGVWLIVRAQALFTPLALALLLAYLVSVPVRWILAHTGWPRAPVVGGVQMLVVLLLLTAPVLIVPRLVALLGAFGATLVKVIQVLLQTTPEPIVITPSLTLDLGIFYEPISQGLRNLLGPNFGDLRDIQSLLYPLTTSAFVVVRGAVSGLVWAIFILAVSFYLVKDAPRIGRFVSEHLPPALLPELHRLWTDLSLVWDAFVRGQLSLSILMGVIVWLAMSALGVANAPALGLVSGLLEFIPGVGPVLAAIPGVLIALILGSSWLPLPNLGFAALTAFTFFLLQQLENIYLVPRVVGRRVALHPIVVMTGALAGAQLGGVLGILLAAPAIASLRLLFTYAYRKIVDEPPFPAAEAVPDARPRWDDLRRSRPVAAVLFDLDGTLIETDDRLVNSLARRLGFLCRLQPGLQPLTVARRWLMISEVLVNTTITVLDALRLDSLLFRLSDTLRRWRGIRHAESFVAVAGTPEMLAALAKRYPLAVVTSRSRAEAQAFLTQYGLTDLCRVVITRDDSARLKPHPMPVRLAAERLRVPAEHCVMVGDTGVDVRAAHAAGALAVGVLCGFGEPSDLADADLVIASTGELGSWL